ncbi:transcriptional regulator SUPERMAN [Vitis vinifera]|uniref:Transcriptional regulator TAC1 n=2 Tax=Vitis vinifera TaxID=29760 RepID=A0A438F0N7_VITVI|nr:transcriptional regulator SUPERMAN [Vitis vinifera]RVW53506.1 Transcriptional regulator TAC1 [Vitis vinifera]RVX19334.1 Transcriptional regulator TAC1 [Vitis vinifera]CAN60537.1 hypothetical protein VITISV_010583 [Vitis vinifera]|eukprot:XP_003632388.1 PREDICTED: transcriptional regulator SUPERMAN [Vitis vinifera]
MESGPREEARNSSEETERPEQEEDEEMITGPSYDCVFCKRGFTTAQALGGHMNIHRKDRAKAKPPSSVLPKKPEENFVNSGFCVSILSYKPPNSTAPEAQINYQEYILASTSPARDPIDDFRAEKQETPNVCKEDWRTCLSLQVGPSCAYDSKEKGQEEKQEDELDLELRLGHNP